MSSAVATLTAAKKQRHPLSTPLMNPGSSRLSWRATPVPSQNSSTVGHTFYFSSLIVASRGSGVLTKNDPYGHASGPAGELTARAAPHHDHL